MMKPGPTDTTLMPWVAYSRAADFVSPTTPWFAATQAGGWGLGAADAGVVHGDIEPAEGVDSEPHHRRVGGSVGDDHLGAAPGEQPRHVLRDAACAGDDPEQVRVANDDGADAERAGAEGDVATTAGPMVAVPALRVVNSG
jgi:hypothetical protein